jgi:hypothetical protein
MLKVAEADPAAEVVRARAAEQPIPARPDRPQEQVLRETLAALHPLQTTRPEPAVGAPMRDPLGSTLTIPRLAWKMPPRPEVSLAERLACRRKASSQLLKQANQTSL